MNSSRYTLVDERYSYPVKRRARGPRDGKRSEPAITLLPPDPYLVMEKPEFARSPSPTMYRTAPPRSAKNKEASSFVILGETIRTPVQSRPGSPSGRVSPFRGHGFKSPTTTRPNSRAASPAGSPKKIYPVSKPVKVSDRPRIGRDIGLPPKSPMKSKPQNVEVKPTPAENTESSEEKTEAKEKPPPEGEDSVVTEDPAIASSEPAEPPKEKASTQESQEINKPLEKPEQPKQPKQPKQRLTPATVRDKKPPVSPRPKAKTVKNEAEGQQSVIKKTTKPPIPPKKIGLKTTLKTEAPTTDSSKKSAKEAKPKDEAEKKTGKGKEETEKKNAKEKEESDKKIVKEESEPAEPAKSAPPVKKEEPKEVEKPKEAEKKKAEEPKEEAKVKAEEKTEGKEGEKKPEKLVPCFQPDKCQIAPPTMASPSPIITPTISTPSTTADLASSSMKSSQSIAAAPTTVTPSSLSSVSSTVVLTGNLARKEIENRNRQKEAAAAAGVVVAKEPKDPSLPEKVAGQMVKAASRDSIKWTARDSLSGEITSTTKVIKGEPEMEVLSPNNLRESPPRVPPPPPNVAWDEGRLPNGDVPSKPEAGGKFRRFLATIWRFLCYLFCCRCLKAPKCCRRTSNQESSAKPSFFSRLNCGKCCRNPFKCCCKSNCCQSTCSKSNCCKWNCCKCEGKKCCRKKPKPETSKPKAQKCCAKGSCSCKGCCNALKLRCLNLRYKINNLCRSLFCLNMMCCQNFLRRFKFCHKLKCCQKDGFCSCCNPNVKKETKKLNKKGSRASNNSRDKDNLDVVLVEHTSLMKAAIPVLPSCLAVFCLILNLFVPGFGTVVSGLLCLCFGKPRFSVKDTPKNRVGSFILNTIIGVAQLFTVVFCLVGWGWSVWWGVIMYKLSRRQKRLKLAEKNQKEAEGSNVNHNHVDVEQG